MIDILKYVSSITFLLCLLLVFNNNAYKFKKNIGDARFTSAPLHYLPFADDDGIVTDSRIIEIQDLIIQGAYNPSIETVKDHYLITFRIDNIGQGLIGTAEFDKDFNQISTTKLFEITHDLLPHDPRLFYYKNKLYLLYSHASFGNKISLDQYTIPPWHLLTAIKQTLVQIDSDYHLKNSIALNYGTDFEKNWTPFEYIDESGTHNLNFMYSFNPLEVITLKQDGFIQQIVPPSSCEILKEHWTQKWGFISGGTPAHLIDNEYLTFFHSYFYSENKRIYVLGALTFNAHPPFKIHKISRYPIIFRNCYSMHNKEASPWGKNKIKYVLFPGGFTPAIHDKDNTLVLACGENDCAIRIVMINKNKLFESMRNL